MLIIMKMVNIINTSKFNLINIINNSKFNLNNEVSKIWFVVSW
jgi:hypothetical protein